VVAGILPKVRVWIEQPFEKITTVTIVIFFLWLTICPASAHYLNVIVEPTPTNNPMEEYVYQGDQIYMNRMYDLSGVYGTNKSFAHWNDWKEEDGTCNPDQVVNLNYITNTQTLKIKQVPITSPPFVLGNWYQWDGCQDLQDANGRIRDHALFPNENRLAFTIIPLPQTEVKEITTVPTMFMMTPRPTIEEIVVKSTPEAQRPVKDQGPPLIIICAAFFLGLLFVGWIIW
jgi:hypothetical protein